MIDFIKNYLRVDFDEDDTIIKLLIDSAKDYIKSSVGHYDENLPKMKLLVAVLCCDWYENRGYANGSNSKTVSEKTKKTVESIINQLRFSNVSE